MRVQYPTWNEELTVAMVRTGRWSAQFIAEFTKSTVNHVRYLATKHIVRLGDARHGLTPESRSAAYGVLQEYKPVRRARRTA